LDLKKKAVLEQQLREWDRNPELLLDMVGNKRLQMQMGQSLGVVYAAYERRPCFALVAVFPLGGMPCGLMGLGSNCPAPVMYFTVPCFFGVPEMPGSDLRTYSQI